MDATALFRQVLHSRRDVVASHWYQAIAPTSFVPLSATQVRQRLADLTEQIITLMLADPLDRDAARSMGVALARLHGIEPQALAATQEVLAQQLVAELPAEQAMMLYPRLTTLLSELAAGFTAQTIEMLLAEQEQIRKALIDERKQVERALRESEERHRTVSELVSDYAYSIRMESDGRMVREWTTGSFTRITGFTTEERDTRGGILCNVHPDDMLIAQQYYQCLFSGNQEQKAIEFRIVTKSGEERWVRAYARPKWDEAQGHVMGFIGALQDITERKQAEMKLQEAEARYRTLVERIPAITYIAAIDEASTTLYVSPQIETILGFSPADYRANPDIWRERLHPDDRERVLTEVACSHATGEPLTSDYRMLTRDGRVVWFHDEAVLVCDADGRPLFLQGVMLDITERKRTEAALQESEVQYRSLVETSPDGIALVDLDARIVLCNRRDAVLLGYESTEEMIGKNALDLVAPEDRSRAMDHMRQTLETGSARNVEVTLLRKDGTRFAVEISGSIIMNIDGQPQFLVVVVHDITERKRVQEALRESELRYRTLFESAPMGIGLATLEGQILAQNDAMCQITGYSGAYPQINLRDTYQNPEERAVLLKRLQVDGFVRDFEVGLKRKDGTPYSASLTIARLTLGGEDVLLTMEEDITRRKQAEEALRESETKFRSLVEQSSDGIMLFDQQGLVIEWNQGQEQITGLKRDDVVGCTIWDVLRQIASGRSQDPATYERNKVALTEFLRTGQVPWLHWLTQYDILRPDGMRRTVQTVLFPIQTKSGFMAGATTHDITVQRQIEELLMRHAQEMEALYKTSLEINTQPDVTMLLQAIVQRAAELIGTQMGGLYLMRPDGETLELVVSHNLPGDYLGIKLHLGEGLAGRVAQTGKPMAIDDYLHWEKRAAVYANAPLHRVLGVPLKVGARVIGVIDVTDDKTIGPFGEDEIRLASLFADQAAIAIENARLYEAEQEQRELAETMREISAVLASTLDMNIVLDRLLANISRIVPNDAADVMLVEGDRAHFVRWYGYERFGIQDLTNVAFLIADRPDLQQMLKTCEPVFVSDTHTDSSSGLPPIMEWLRSYAGAPICVRGETIGFLDVTSAEPGAFGQPHAERLRAFADQAAIALENARLFEQARKASERLQSLSHRLVEVQEAERRSIARELHDEIGQTLTAVKINLQALQRSPDVSAHASVLEENVSIIERTLQQVRNLSLDLRPSLLDDLGLVPALRWYVNRQAERAGFAAIFMADSLEAQLSPDLEMACFRVVQEALTNVARHARAQHVLVELRQRATELELTIRDDGVGFDVRSTLQRAAHGASLGLLGMDERVVLVGGQMEIESVLMHGTEIRARFPLALLSSGADGSSVR